MTEDQFIEMQISELKIIMVEMSVAFYRVCKMFDIDVDEIRQRAAVEIAEGKLRRINCDVCKTNEGILKSGYS